MFSSRRDFLKQLSLGTGAFILLDSPGFCREAGGSSLPGSAPEAMGVDSAGIEAFLDGIAAAKHELHSFMMVRHGKVVAEGWWAPYAENLRHTMYSMSKSFTSTAVGFAVSEGKLSVDDKVTSFFPKDLPEQVSENLAALRVRDLLTMSVGNEKEPTGDVVKQENWVKAFLAAPITHAPGSTFLYNSAATYMCSAIVQKVTTQKVIQYLQPRLFAPLGIKNVTWETCPRGINTGGWGLSIQTEGLAKFGQTLLQKGQWEGKQIIPQKWVEEATAFHIQQPDPAKPSRPKEKNDWLQGYGYQFWRCQHGGFRGDGAFGQYTIVLPEQDVVIAMTGESANMQGELDLVWEHLLPAIKDAPLPENTAAHSQLTTRLAALALQPPAGEASSPTGTRLIGKSFKLGTNSLGLEKVIFGFGKDSTKVTFTAASAVHVLNCGVGKWEMGKTALPGVPPRIIAGGAPPIGTFYPVAVSGVWKDENTFEITLRYYETPHHDILTCAFDGDKTRITFLSSIAAMPGKAKDSRPVLEGQFAS